MNKPLVYLDSNVFLAWLNEERMDDPEFWEQVSDVLESQKYTLMTSALAYTEVFPRNAEDAEKFRALMDAVEVFPMTADIAKCAGKLRVALLNSERIAAPAAGGKGLQTPDAIHVATALLRGAEYFCTKDHGILKLEEDINFQVTRGKKIKITRTPLNRN